MKKLPKKLIRTLGVLLGVVLVVTLGLRLFFPAEKIKELAVDLASDKLGRQVTVAEAGLSLSGGLGVKLVDVVIANPAGFPGEPLFTAEKIDLKLQLGPLMQREFQVGRLVVDRPEVRLVRQAGGDNNFTFEFEEMAASESGTPSIPEEGKVESDLAVRFDRMEIHGGHLTYMDEETGQGVGLEGLDMTGNLSNPGPGLFQSSGRIAVDTLQVAGDQPVPPLAVEVIYDLTFDAPQKVMEISRGDFEVGGLPVEFTGRMSVVPDSLTATGVAKAEGIALNDLLEFLTAEQRAPLEPFTIAGVVGVAVEVDFDQARAEPLDYTGRAVVGDVRATSTEVEGELKVSRIVAGFRPNDLKIASEGGTFADQPLELVLAVSDFEDPLIDGEVSGELDLNFVQPFLPAEKNIQLAGRCILNSSFSGRANDVENLQYNGRAEFRDVSYSDPSLPDSLHALTGTVAFDPASVTIEKLVAQFGAGDLTLTGKMVNHLPYFLPAEKENRASLPKPDFTFSATSTRIDIDKLFPAVTPGAGPEGGEKIEILPDSVATEAVPDMLATGTIQADTLIYSQVPFTGVSGKIRFADKMLTCYDVTAGVYGGQAAGNVAIDLNNLNEPAYIGDFEAREIEADNFITRFAGYSGLVFGKTGMKGSFQARGRDPAKIRNTLTLDSEAAMVSGKVVTGQFVDSALGSLAAKAGQKLDREQGLKDLSTLIKVENGRVGLNDLTTKLGSFGDLTLGGSYGFAGDLQYNGSILLTKEQTTSLYSSGGLVGSVANLFGNKAERLRLPISVGGTMTSPKMDIDYSELTDNLRSQLNDDLKEEVGRKLKGLFGK